VWLKGSGTRLELARQLQRPNNAKLHWRLYQLEIQRSALLIPDFAAFS